MSLAPKIIIASNLIAFSALLAFASCASATSKPATAYEPTGDALYDSYARLLLEHMEQANWNAAPVCWISDEYSFIEWLPTGSPDGATQQPRLIDCHEVLQWKDRFGSDSRYWELRRLAVSGEDYDAAKVRAKAELLQLDELCRAENGTEGTFALLLKNAGHERQRGGWGDRGRRRAEDLRAGNSAVRR
jgi:hypothetical protein